MINPAFIVGNGESRKIFGDLQRLKKAGTVYGCNAIYRDNPTLCDKIFAVDKRMFDELVEAKNNDLFTSELVGLDKISDWNYVLPGDQLSDVPESLKIYRLWQGGDAKTGGIKTRDFAENKGTGCSAVLSAAEHGFKHIFLLGFDILGSRQWEYTDSRQSREQNNVYKNTINYPDRKNMKAYLKYEWMYQLTQIARRFTDTEFYFVNRKEYINDNYFLPHYINYTNGNFQAISYADLQRFTDNPQLSTIENFKWIIKSTKSP